MSHAGRARGGVGGGAQPVGLGPHPTVLRRGVVIPPEQVKQAVRQEHRQLGDEIAFALVGLAARGRDAHDDVSQQAVRLVSVLAFVLRESQHVGGSILTAIDPVQFLDLIVTRKQYRKLTVAHLKSVEHGACPSRHVGARNTGMRPVLHDQAYGHRSVLSAVAFARPPRTGGGGSISATFALSMNIFIQSQCEAPLSCGQPGVRSVEEKK
jgi:hypothetical protein